MFLFRILLFGFLAISTIENGHATVSNPNPNLAVSILGAENFTLQASGIRLPGFAVRVTDPQGLPIAGLVVEFLVDKPLCAPLQPCNLPPASLYGLFANGRDFIQVGTDANGIARTGEYVAGTSSGTYRIAALILCLNSLRNCEVLKGQGSPAAYFGITQSIALLDGYMSGNWYDPAHSGQGLQLEFTDQNNTVLAIWFVFGPDGGQNWISAQGTYDSTKNTVTLPAVILTGAKFPPLFKTSDLQSTPWGTITLSFVDCNRGTLAWNSALPGYGAGSMSLVRLTSIRGTKCPA